MCVCGTFFSFLPLLWFGYSLLTLACLEDLITPGVVVPKPLGGPLLCPPHSRSCEGKRGQRKVFLASVQARLGGEPRSMATRRARKLLGCKVGCFPWLQPPPPSPRAPSSLLGCGKKANRIRLSEKKEEKREPLQAREGIFVHCVSLAVLCLESGVWFCLGIALRAARAEKGWRADWELAQEKEGGLFSGEGRRVLLWVFLLFGAFRFQSLELLRQACSRVPARAWPPFIRRLSGFRLCPAFSFPPFQPKVWKAHLQPKRARLLIFFSSEMERLASTHP